MVIKTQTFSVCVLAHNEERSIKRTIESILNSIGNNNFSITIYANGCTDDTLQIVLEMQKIHSHLAIVEIDMASKINAWNRAFRDQASDIIIFCDGDIVPDKGAILNLVDDLSKDEKKIISSSRLFPLMAGQSFESLFVGFMQLPLKHEYLSGGMYALKREKLIQKFSQNQMAGIPMGITGEDYFLERLIDPSEFVISKAKNYYDPPILKDYIRYLARIRWQNEQMKFILGPHRDNEISKLKLIRRKFFGHRNFLYLFISIPATITRYIFKKIYAKKINEAFLKLGPVVRDGEKILTQMTRSYSTK